MGPWSVLKAVTRLIDGSGLPDQPPSRVALLWHIALGALAIVFRRQNVAVLPNKLNVGAEETVFTECATLYDVLFGSIRHRRPVFVLPGTLAPLCRFFGIDNDHVLTLRCSSSGLAICFGHLHGMDVVVHASVNGEGKWLARQSVGAKIGRELMGALGPATVDLNQTRLITARLPGHPMPWNLTEDQLQASIFAALEPLKQLFDSGHWTGHPDDELIDALQSYVMQSSHQTQLKPALDLIKHWDRTHVKTVSVHGDYWLNNMLFSDGRVTGVIDWDRTRRNGCAGIDALHLAFMSYAVWSDIPVSELLADVCTKGWHFPWLSSYCALIEEAFSLNANDLKYLGILLWLSYFPFYDELHPDVQPNRGSGTADWHAQMISPMYKAILAVQHQPAFCRGV